MQANNKSLADVRAHLFAALEGLKNGTMEVQCAMAVNAIGQTLVSSAKVEVDFLRTTDGFASSFIAPDDVPALPNGIVSVTQHRLKG